MAIRTKLLIFLSLVMTCNAWAQSHDLDFYVSNGLNNSPLLKDYHNQILSDALDSQQVAANYRPQVNAVSNNAYYPVINGYGYDPVITNNGEYSALVNVNQSFVGRKNLRAQYRSIGLQNDSIKAQKKISEQELKRTITAQYITAYGDLQQVDLNNKINELLRYQDTVLRRLTETNVYRQADYLAFKVTLQQQELNLKQLRIQYRTDLATLNYVCGIYDTAYVALDSPLVTLQTLPGLSSSVFFKKFLIDSLKLTNDAALLNYSYRPKLSAFVNGGFYSSLTYESYKNFGTGLGLSVAVPIYDGHKRKLALSKIKLQENTRSYYQDFFSRQYQQQVAQLKQQLNATQSLVGDIEQQIKYSETLIKVDGRLLTTGDARIADFIIAINNYLVAKNLLTQNSISRMQIINQINYWNR